MRKALIVSSLLCLCDNNSCMHADCEFFEKCLNKIDDGIDFVNDCARKIFPASCSFEKGVNANLLFIKSVNALGINFGVSCLMGKGIDPWKGILPLGLVLSESLNGLLHEKMETNLYNPILLAVPAGVASYLGADYFFHNKNLAGLSGGVGTVLGWLYERKWGHRFGLEWMRDECCGTLKDLLLIFVSNALVFSGPVFAASFLPEGIKGNRRDFVLTSLLTTVMCSLKKKPASWMSLLTFAFGGLAWVSGGGFSNFYPSGRTLTSPSGRTLKGRAKN